MDNTEWIFVGQEALQLRLDTKLDLSGASDLKIKYKKPNGSTGEWAGILYSTTYIQKSFINDANELDKEGIWTFWTCATMSDGRLIQGKPVQYQVRAEGSTK